MRYEHHTELIVLPQWVERMNKLAAEGWEFMEQARVAMAQVSGSVVNAQGQAPAVPVMLCFFRRAVNDPIDEALATYPPSSLVVAA